MTFLLPDDPMKRLLAAQAFQQVGGLLNQWGGGQPLPQIDYVGMHAYGRGLEKQQRQDDARRKLMEIQTGTGSQTVNGEQINWNPQAGFLETPQGQGLLFEAYPKQAGAAFAEQAFGQPAGPSSSFGKFVDDYRRGLIPEQAYQVKLANLQQQPAPKAPTTRSRIAGDQTVYEQWDPTARQWLEVSRGSRWAPTSQSSGPLPSVSRDFVLPILQKVQSGEPLTANEQAAWDMYSRTGLVDQMLRGMQGGGVPTSYIPTAADPSTTSAAGASEAHLLSYAREAIAGGEDRAAVEQELRGMGIDPSKL